MRRASRGKQKKPKLARQTETASAASRPRRFHRVSAIVATIVAGVATYATIFGFVLPKLSVEPFIDMDIRDPYKQIFMVTNQGNFDVYRASYYCKIKGAWIDGRTERITIRYDKNEWLEIAPYRKGETFRTLASSETDSLTCQIFDEPIPFMLSDRREIAVVISYRPAYFPFTLMRQFGYQLRTSASGSYHWVPIARERE
jgi:hypothetical protein